MNVGSCWSSPASSCKRFLLPYQASAQALVLPACSRCSARGDASPLGSSQCFSSCCETPCCLSHMKQQRYPSAPFCPAAGWGYLRLVPEILLPRSTALSHDA